MEGNATIWARSLWTSVDVVARAGFSTRELFHGLTFDAFDLPGLLRVSWDEYCVVVDRAERLVGGPEAFGRVFARHFHETMPELATGAALSPRDFYTFTNEVVMPVLVPAVELRVHSPAPGRLRIEGATATGLRTSSAYFSGGAGVMRGLTHHLGLAQADVAAKVGTREVRYDVRLPPSTVARDVGAEGAHWQRLATWFVLGTASNGEEVVAGLAFAKRRPPRPKLTPRQRDVLEHVVRGMANKEIAVKLGCAENTIEFHLTAIFRKFAVASRAELIARVLGRPG